MIIRFFKIGLLLAVAAIAARGEVLTVGPHAPYQSIALAISAAVDGDTVRVESGAYNENLILSKSIRLEGVNSPHVIGSGSGSVIIVAAANSSIIGFRITNSGRDLQAEDAGILLRSNGNTIEDNELSDVLFGIYLLHSADNSIRRNRIAGRAEVESGERGAGLHLWNSPLNLLEDNVISHARDGMYIQSSPNNTIRRNRVSNLRYGLHYMNSDNNRFEDNVFHDNVAGAAIMYSKNIELRRNAFVRNRGFSSFGILFQDCQQCITEQNLILNNAVGLFLEATNGSVFRSNTIAENDVALQIFASSAENTFTGNNFINNLSPLQMVGLGSRIRPQSENMRGNYWSEYDGYDLDSDGIGDVPHKIQNIFEYLEGNLPRLRIYLNSPAARSVELAERSFPILKGSNEFDRQPLMKPVDIDLSFKDQPSGASAKWVMFTAALIMLGVSGTTFVVCRKR